MIYKYKSILKKLLWLGLLGSVLSLSSCSTDARLAIEGGNPPRFVLSGGGTLQRITISGSDIEREAQRSANPDAVPYTTVYWQIVPDEEMASHRLSRISPIVYGVVPEGFSQTFPKNGAPPPPLVEGPKYNVTIAAHSSHGVNMFFVIKEGKVYSEGD